MLRFLPTPTTSPDVPSPDKSPDLHESHRMNNSRVLYLFTRTPLHVGAGSSVGAIDQPIQRERHTGFPLIPASSLKGSFADQWPAPFLDARNQRSRVRTQQNDGNTSLAEASEAAWLFGSDVAAAASAGALQFGEARLLAFPIRSARGSFAWISSPLILRRAARDGIIASALLDRLEELPDAEAICEDGKDAKLTIDHRLVLEEYTFAAKGWPGLTPLGDRFAGLLHPPGEEADPVWSEVASRLVILSDGMMSFFAKNACEVAQHVRINDETGTADPGGLFNQENVPSETLFYAVIHATGSRLKCEPYTTKTAMDALDAFAAKVGSQTAFQFGGDASTGLGYCTARMDVPLASVASSD